MDFQLDPWIYVMVVDGMIGIYYNLIQYYNKVLSILMIKMKFYKYIMNINKWKDFLKQL